MFILGMTIGVTGGTVFGVVLICCLIAGKRGDAQIEQRRMEREENSGHKGDASVFWT